MPAPDALLFDFSDSDWQMAGARILALNTKVNVTGAEPRTPSARADV